MNRSQIIEEILNNFHCIMKQMKSKARVHEKNQITHSQWFVLGILKHSTQANLKDLASQLGISASAATQLVDGLVEKGYVTRKEDPQDRRAVKLSLSAKGKKRISLMKKKRLEKMALLFAPLSQAELEDYLKVNQKITSHLLNSAS